MRTKSLFISILITVIFFTVQNYSIPAHAGDREWATVGKILTGVVGAGLIYETFNNGYYYRDGYYYRPRTYYRSYYEVPDVIIIERPSRGPYYHRRHGYYRDRYYDRVNYRPRHHYKRRIHCY